MLGVSWPFRVWRAVMQPALVITVLVAAWNPVPALGDEPSVEDLKARLSSASVGDRPRLCVQIAEKQLIAADRFYAQSEIEKGEAALTDVVAFSELARDYAIQSRKYQKQTEIAVRGMTRKLNDLMHTLAHDEREPVQDAIKRLQRVRDDLLIAMFPKGAK